MSDGFVSVENVSKRFEPQVALGDRIAALLGGEVEKRAVRAVDNVSLSIAKGEVLGLVGESGSGKSTLGRMISGIYAPTSGTVRIAGEPVMSEGRHPRKRTTRVQMIFQDPYASLDPRMRVGDTIAEGPIAHRLITRAKALPYVQQWLGMVGMPPEAADRYPHQFSDMLVCDEPVASLDVSIQAQVLNLFLKLRRELSLTMLFISHHLGVVRHVSDRVAIMYLGRIVEIGAADAIYAAPRHPYTQALLASVPQLVLEDDAIVTFQPIQGELPSPLSPPPGCHFHLRCPIAEARCRSDIPAMRPAGPTQTAACHLVTP
jgi:peptide/nickel transport system ATP-binding protein